VLFALVDEVDGPKLVGHIDRPVRVLTGGELFHEAVVADDCRAIFDFNYQVN